MIDNLEYLLQEQERLQRILGAYPEFMDQKYIETMILAIHSEANEILNETNWKPWKSKKIISMDKVQEEIIDLLHFTLNLMIAARMSPEDVMRIYKYKRAINIKRHKERY